MQKIKIEIDEDKILFATHLQIRVNDLNPGGHLGNDSFISLVHEARAQFFAKFGWNEANIDNTNIGIIISDLVVNYLSQGRYQEQIEIKISIESLRRRTMDMFYLLKKSETQQLLGKCMTRLFFFNYETNRIARIPETFLNILKADALS